MIKLKEISFNDNRLVCQLDGLTNTIQYKGYTLTNGVNEFSSQGDINRIVNILVHEDDLTIENEKAAFTFKKQCYDYLLSESEIEEFKVEPFWHQIMAVNYGLQKKHKKWLLLDSMGLGKTAEIIWYAETLKKRGLIEHCLIICGVDSLRQNWKSEINMFSNESVRVLGERVTRTGKIRYNTMTERLEELKKPISEFFLIINAATLRNEKIVELLKKQKYTKFDFIAVDEVHRFSSATSQQGKGLLKLNADYKIAATGSLLMNNPVSCFVPLSWTENDQSILSTFRSQYVEEDEKHKVTYRNLDVLKDEISSCMLRRTLDEVRDDMPKKMIVYETVEMTEEHRKFYDAIKDGIEEEADKVELNITNLLAMTTRLRQASSCPEVLTSQEIISSKVLRAAELVEELVEQGEKVVVFSFFKPPVYQLAKLLEKYHPTVNTGDQDKSEVYHNKEMFQNDPNSLIFLGTHSMCGTGYTLNAASYMICLDTPFTHGALSQSTDRIWRVTNTRPAFITILMCNDSVDERVRTIVELKKSLGEYLLDEHDNLVQDPSVNDTDMLKWLLGFNNEPPNHGVFKTV